MKQGVIPYRAGRVDEPSAVAQAWNFSIWEAETGGFGVGDQSELQNKTPLQLTTSEEAKGCGQLRDRVCA